MNNLKKSFREFYEHNPAYCLYLGILVLVGLFALITLIHLIH